MYKSIFNDIFGTFFGNGSAKENLLKLSKEELVDKVMNLEKAIKSKTEFESAISNAIAAGFNSLINPSSTDGKIKLATNDYVKSCYIDISHDIVNKVEDLKNHAKKVNKLNETIDEYRKYDIISMYRTHANKLDPFGDEDDTYIESMDEAMKQSISKQVDYNTGFNDCLDLVKSNNKKIKGVSKRSL